MALCRLREKTKSWDRLAILLWLDGWQVAFDRLRRAVLSDLPDPAKLGVDATTDEGLDKLDEFARKRGPAFARRAGLGRVGPAAAQNAILAALAAGLGGAPFDEEAATSIERVAGLARARTDALGDTGPWLTGSAAPVDLTGIAVRSRELAQHATRADFEAARPRARAFANDLPLGARGAELGLGRNFAGLAFLSDRHTTPGMAVGLALFFADIGFGEQMDAMATAWSGLAAQVAATQHLVEAYIAKHPEQRRAIRTGGLQGLIDRGEVLPFEPEELEALLGSGANAAPSTPRTEPD
jgi:hypothetical protein